jgi:glycosyltransferase involved in cell wall biosynthesis
VKIAIVINSLEGGGAERVACTLATHLRREQHEVLIVTLHGGAIAYELPADVTVRHLRSRRFMHGWQRLALLPVAAAELTFLLAREKPDATISFLTRSNLAHVLTRLYGNRRPIFISERVDAEAEYIGQKRVLGEMVRRLYAQADHIVAISEGVRQSLGRMAIPLTRITTIHNPQNLAAIRAAAASAPPRPTERRPFRVVMAGRLTRQKGYPTMLDALSILVNERKLDVRLVVLGEGPDGPALAAQAEHLGVWDCIEWVGWVKDIHAVMGSCDAFAFTSLYEGFGNALVEAMACGLPVVSTDCPSGPAEILDGGRYGFLVPVGDAKAIADALASLMSDDALHADYAQRAREGAARFDVATVAARYLAVMGVPLRSVERTNVQAKARAMNARA